MTTHPARPSATAPVAQRPFYTDPLFLQVLVLVSLFYLAVAVVAGPPIPCPKKMERTLHAHRPALACVETGGRAAVV